MAAARGSRPAEVAQAQLLAAQASSEAVSVAEQAYSAAAAAAAAASGKEGWLAKAWGGWRRAAGGALRRAARPEVAALELGRCLLVQARVQLALSEAPEALGSLHRALGLLAAKPPAATDPQQQGAASEKLETLRQEALCDVLAALLGATEQVHGAQSVEAASVKTQLSSMGCSSPGIAAN